MWKQIGPAFRVTLLFTVLTGLIYPALVTALCQLVFPNKADGSLVKVNGQLVGSSLIGQNFAKPEYFQPRPSAAGNDGYDATASQGSNYGPTNQKLIDRVKASVEKFRKANPDHPGSIPADLVTASGSGLDPHLSPAAAQAQAARIARARGISVQQVQQLITENTEGRTLGLLGEPRVNVLLLNLALDQKFPRKGS
jgi:potassium-transporting ATPase KdpC subunit